MSTSVLIPSALRRAPDGTLWLTRALRSVFAQTQRPDEVIVGLDPDAELPPELHADRDMVPPLRVAHGTAKGHQEATNAAARAAGGRLLAILEDDDEWLPTHLELLSEVMDRSGAEFVSASQTEVNPDGTERYQEEGVFRTPAKRAFHFPTPSSWLVTRLLWMKIGGFCTNFLIHHDNRFLNQLCESGAKRVHVIPEGTDLSHPWLVRLAQSSPIIQLPGLKSPTVLRTIHEESVMGTCRKDPAKAERSAKEYAALEVMHGIIGW